MLRNHPGRDSEIQQFNLRPSEAVIRVVPALRKTALKNCSADQNNQRQANLSALSPLKGHEGERILLPSLPVLSPLTLHLLTLPTQILSPSLPPSLLSLLMLHPIIY